MFKIFYVSTTLPLQRFSTHLKLSPVAPTFTAEGPATSDRQIDIYMNFFLQILKKKNTDFFTAKPLDYISRK